MTRLQDTFTQLGARGEQALVAYVTGGDPDLETSYQVLEALARGGADIIELGVPFSDPTADGPTIQRASVRALAAGATVSGVLSLVSRLRAAGHQQPVILFGYYNPFLQYGLDRLAADAASAGADGFLVVDLPPEEAGPFQAAIRSAVPVGSAGGGLDLIQLLTPTSTERRIAAVAKAASGFVYYVSRTGVTGAQEADLTTVGAQVARIRSAIDLPVCVGFGIARPDQVAALRGTADGVVVGSALVNLVEQLGQGTSTVAAIEAAVRGLKAPLTATAAR
jgi:tryptophan synthase alpha chain